jgi:hypothetical protein
MNAVSSAIPVRAAFSREAKVPAGYWNVRSFGASAPMRLARAL